MEIREISFYHEFECLAGDCPENCCHGWVIPLEEEDVLRFQKEKSLLKLKLIRATLFTGETFNPYSGTCPFHQADGLCELQLKKGHDFLPEVCRMYPRFYRNYGPFEEHYADLSCIHAAELFLSHLDDLFLTAGEGESLTPMIFTNDDDAYLKLLEDSREDLIRTFRTADSFDRLAFLITAAASYARSVQDSYLNRETDYLLRIPFSAYCETFRDGHPEGSSARFFPFSSETIRDLMDSSLFHPRLKQTDPSFYKMCMLYFETYKGRMSSNNGWEELYLSFAGRYPELSKAYAGYFIYYLYLYYLKSYEDYSFRKNTLLGIIHLNLVFMLSVLREKKEGHFDAASLSSVISLYNRRACFNANVLDDMYKCIDYDV
ncbi:MAG: flagellin lysine-N-methylase [Lachnospiraceae bacterium]|nr:flagellin lysine-N-methylase [Lachnospiraceae bacterium]